MTLFITLEGVRSNTKALIYAHLKRHLSSRKDCKIVDIPHVECQYERSLRMLKALSAVGKGARVVLCPASFYTHSKACDKVVWLDGVRALNSKLAPGVDTHLMVSIMSDEHGVFSENMTKQNGASLEDIAEATAAVLETAKKPSGHPWKAKNVIVPVPRYVNDMPAFVEKISADISTVIAKMAPFA
jgi:L-fucose mutarotase/ribose pyranase (RbsD/FucU family)